MILSFRNFLDKKDVKRKAKSIKIFDFLFSLAHIAMRHRMFLYQGIHIIRTFMVVGES